MDKEEVNIKANTECPKLQPSSCSDLDYINHLLCLFGYVFRIIVLKKGAITVSSQQSLDLVKKTCLQHEEAADFILTGEIIISYQVLQQNLSTHRIIE